MTMKIAAKAKRIPLSQIVANPDQPRKLFDAAALQELAASIDANSLLQPITVRPVSAKKVGEATTYMIVAGERRFRAHKLLADMGKLPDGCIDAIVKVIDEKDMAVFAIIENLQRADIQPMEEARAFQAMLDAGYTVPELVRTLGLKSRDRILDRTALLSLATEHQKLVEGGHLKPSMATEIARLPQAMHGRFIRQIAVGTLKTTVQVQAAVIQILDADSQGDLLPDAPRATDADVATLNRMEGKIDSVANLLAAGWKDNECTVATKVSPDRAGVMADKIQAMIVSLYTMERQLRGASAAQMILAAE